MRQAGFLNGKPSVNMLDLPSARRQHHHHRRRRESGDLPSLEATIPRGEHSITVLDRTLTIRASVIDIERTLVISVLLVIGVVFVFLRNVRATLFRPSPFRSRSSAPAP